MLPFTPAKRDNLASWLSAYQDEDNYGKLLFYMFPKNDMAYVSLQIENRIDENEDISRDMAPWNAHGSSVIRGNLLVIPIRGAILYVEPVYISANREGSKTDGKFFVNLL